LDPHPEHRSERRAAPAWPRKLRVLGIAVSATTYDEVADAIMAAARERRPAVVTAAAVHAVVTAARDPALREQLNRFDAVLPDGQPVRWALNALHRAGLSDRVYGPELMLRLCRRAAEDGTAVYLYGSAPDVVERLRQRLSRRFPSLRVAGCESPPFRALTPGEDRGAVERIERSGAGLVFIGLGCPRQEEFAAAHRGRIRAVLVCVGAAFDFHSGNKRMAPAWMQRHGLEWAFRLASEPRRLWRRYLVTNTVFLSRLALELLRARVTGGVSASGTTRRSGGSRPRASSSARTRAP
jgi:exopolysaccharide biosynthesis WecB/TagA/CpsF family protein